MWYFKIVSNFTRLKACEISYHNNFEKLLVVLSQISLQIILLPIQSENKCTIRFAYRWLHLLISTFTSFLILINNININSNNNLAINEWGWVGYEEGVIKLGFQPRWITPSEICLILHILRKLNSLIALLFIQDNS